MVRALLQLALATAFAAALSWMAACAANGPEVGTSGPLGSGFGGPAPFGSSSGPPSPEQRTDCGDSVQSCIEARSNLCVVDWAAAQTPATWATASPDGCARLGTIPCAGFWIAEPGETDNGSTPAVRQFFDVTSGQLVAVVGISDPTSSDCIAGPPGFTDPLIINCQPPLALVCAGSVDGGAVVDAAAEAATDAGADAGD